MGTKDEPAPFDCYANAEPDEPMFVLLARDSTASLAVRNWCYHRVTAGKNKMWDPQITEAYECADAMDEWRRANREAGQ